MDPFIALILTYRYVILFPLAVIEGPLLTVLAGFLASQGIFHLIYLYPLFVVGDTIGDSIQYALGRYGTSGLLGRFGSNVGATPERMQKLSQQYQKHFVKTIFAAKLIHGVGVVGLIAAGSLRLSYLRYVVTCGLVSLLQAGFLLLVGYYFGHLYAQIAKYFDYYAAVGSVLVLFGILAYWFHGHRAQKGDGAL